MARILLFFLAVCIAGSSLAQKSGMLDRAFGVNGIAATTLSARGAATSIQVLSDNRIVAYYQQYTATRQLPALLRFLSNGKLDSSFGTGGKALPFSGPTNFLTTKMIIQPDGKILCTGGAYDTVAQTVSAFVFRCLPDGALDATFGTAGITIVGMSNATNFGQDIGLHRDGRITVVGQALDDNTNAFLTGAFRLLPNGLLDTSFSGGGIAVFNPGGTGFNVTQCVFVRPDDRIIIGGRGGNDLFFLQLKADGSPDASFAPSGKISFALSDVSTVYKVIPDAGGKILFSVVTSSNSSSGTGIIGRLRANGSFDTSFAHTGLFSFDAGHADCFFQDFLVDKDSNIICLGTRNSNSSANQFLLKLNQKGDVQTYFGTAGYATDTADFGGASLGLQSDNKIIVGGGLYYFRDTARLALVRYNNQQPAGIRAQPGEQSSIVLSPIPVRDLVRISSPAGEPMSGGYRITDITGHTVMQKAGSRPTRDMEADVSGLPAGMYYIHLTAGAGAVVRPLLIAH